MGEDDVVELGEREFVAEAVHGALPELQYLQPADYVGAGLTRIDDVTLDLGDHLAFGHAGIGQHVVDGPLAGPLAGVNAGVDDQADGAKDQAGDSSWAGGGSGPLIP